MTSLLLLRPSPPPLPSWLADAVPYAYEEAARVQFQAMPGIRWVRDASTPNGRGFYRGPRDAVEIVAATLEGAGVCKVRNDVTASTDTVQQVFNLSFESGYPLALREYQVHGAAWCRHMLRTTGGALLADEMGLGKTPQAICAVAPFDGSRLVVCPAVVVPHWEAEISKWSNGVISEIDKAAGEVTITLPEWYVTSWDKFARKAAELAKQQWSLGIFDELHYASNYQGGTRGAGRAKAAHAFRKAQPNLPILGLTGTPMPTKPIDLWSPLELLWPSRFGKWFDFGRRYCNGHHEAITNATGAQVTNAEGEPLKPAWVCNGISRPEELRARLAHCMLRRTKAQVGGELPPRTRVITPITIPAAARKDIKAASFALDFDGAAKSAVGALLRETEIYKVDAAEAIARDVLAAGSRPLLLTTRRRTCAELASRLGCPGVTGDDSANERRDILQGQQCGVATGQSVETGINLTGFDALIFVGLDWVPAAILQREARIHRIGQDRPVTIYYLIAKGTIDEVIQQRVIERLENFNAITGAEGDELGLAHDLAPETEEDLIAAIVAAVKGKKAA